MDSCWYSRPIAIYQISAFMRKHLLKNIIYTCPVSAHGDRSVLSVIVSSNLKRYFIFSILLENLFPEYCRSKFSGCKGALVQYRSPMTCRISESPRSHNFYRFGANCRLKIIYADYNNCKTKSWRKLWQKKKMSLLFDAYKRPVVFIDTQTRRYSLPLLPQKSYCVPTVMEEFKAQHHCLQQTYSSRIVFFRFASQHYNMKNNNVA